MNTKNFIKNPLVPTNKEIKPLKAYELWAGTYDNEYENLMLYFDGLLFEEFLTKVNLNGKKILDFGCGTGRHWKKLLERNPIQLVGCDISKSMMEKLKEKYPDSETYVLQNNKLDFLDDNSFDFIISTLVIAHIPDIADILKEWNRLLKKDGEIFITDFHPEALRKGAKRTFKKNGKTITIKNYIYPVEKLEYMFSTLEFSVINRNEKIVNEDVKEFYVKKNALNIYEEYKNVPMIYSLHLVK